MESSIWDSMSIECEHRRPFKPIGYDKDYGKGLSPETFKLPIVILPENLAYLGKQFEESTMGEVIPIELHGRFE